MRSGSKRFIVWATLAAALGSVPSVAQAQQAIDLFLGGAKSPDAAAAKPRPASAGAVRERFADLNPLAVSGDVGLRAEADTQLYRKIRIELFPGLSATFKVTGSETMLGKTVLQAEAGDADEATLVVSDGMITGRVILNGKTYRIQPLGGGLHRIAELSRKLLPDAPHRVVKSKKAPRADVPTKAAADAGTVITIAFAYTPKAFAASANLGDELRLAVAISNRAFAASQLLIRYKLVGAYRAKYDEDRYSYNQMLDDLTGNSSSAARAFAYTRQMRDTVAADLVVGIREGGDYCGVGWVVTPSTGSSGYGYSVVSRGCIESDTVAHETGHNMGLNHDRYVSSPAGNNVYNYGFVNVPARVRDIMSYSDKCSASGVSCEQFPAYSNPRISVKGRPFGIPQGQAGAADAARWLNEVRATVAAYRSAPAASAQAASDASGADNASLLPEAE